ncbi:hypothetical protein QTI66_35300 [Variovorax sp. J22R133]|nr:hypothetical protein [Variovorax sp. J22R133]MDM0117385.1 hypothetical protein [Variovorax sp. J22R133]
MKASTTLRGLALAGTAVLVAAAIASVALRSWLEPASAAALVELFSFCR